MHTATALHLVLAVADDGSCFLAVLHSAVQAELQVGEVTLQCPCPLTPVKKQIDLLGQL